MLISKNSFLVLGLTSDADEKLINKRYKDLSQLVKIWETWDFDTDLNFIDFSEIRTEENIKDAYHRLTNQHKRLQEFFLRFNILDNIDEINLELCSNWDYSEASLNWGENYKKRKKFHYLKNQIILELLMYENAKKIKQYNFNGSPQLIVDGLYNLINEEKFWKEFKEIYNMQNETPIREDIISDFRASLPQFFAEYFFDLREVIKNGDLYKNYSKKFNIGAKNIDDNKSISSILDDIKSNLSEIKWMDLTDELDEVIDGINKIISKIKKLDKLWLNENLQVIKLKDEVWLEIRRLGIALFNIHDDGENAINFIEEAKKIVHSNSLKEKLKKDIEDMNNQSGKTQMFKSILNLHKEGQEYFWNKNFKSAEVIYSWCITLILEQLSEKFELDTGKLNLLMLKIETQFNMVSSWGKTTESIFENIDDMKKLLEEDWWFTWWDDLNFIWLWEDQRLLLMVYIDAVTYRKIADMIANKSSGRSSWSEGSSFPWWIIWLVVAIIISIARNS